MLNTSNEGSAVNAAFKAGDKIVLANGMTVVITEIIGSDDPVSALLEVGSALVYGPGNYSAVTSLAGARRAS